MVLASLPASSTADCTPPYCPPPPGLIAVGPKATVKRGKAALLLTCTGGPCEGTLYLSARVKKGKRKKNLVISKTPVTLASGASTTLKVKLSAAANRELRKRKRLKAKAFGPGVTTSKVKLKLARKKHPARPS